MRSGYEQGDDEIHIFLQIGEWMPVGKPSLSWLLKAPQFPRECTGACCGIWFQHTLIKFQVSVLRAREEVGWAIVHSFLHNLEVEERMFKLCCWFFLFDQGKHKYWECALKTPSSDSNSRHCLLSTRIASHSKNQRHFLKWTNQVRLLFLCDKQCSTWACYSEEQKMTRASFYSLCPLRFSYSCSHRCHTFTWYIAVHF